MLRSVFASLRLCAFALTSGLLAACSSGGTGTGGASSSSSSTTSSSASSSSSTGGMGGAGTSSSGGMGGAGTSSTGGAGGCAQTLCGAACVDTMTDPHDCGACGHDCLGAICLSGACRPVVLASGQAQPIALVVDATNVYFT